MKYKFTYHHLIFDYISALWFDKIDNLFLIASKKEKR